MMSSIRHLYCRAMISWLRFEIFFNASPAVRALESACRGLTRASCLSEATRTWKNSPKLLETMPRKLSRSSRGVSVLNASLKTRALNSSQLSSRLKYLFLPLAASSAFFSSFFASFSAIRIPP